MAAKRHKRFGHARRHKFTVEAGRQVYRDGKPYLSVGREGDTLPTSADEATHLLAACLQRKNFRGRFEKE